MNYHSAGGINIGDLWERFKKALRRADTDTGVAVPPPQLPKRNEYPLILQPPTQRQSISPWLIVCGLGVMTYFYHRK